MMLQNIHVYAGNFGRVYKGLLKLSNDDQLSENQSPGPCPVAVKSLLPGNNCETQHIVFIQH